MTKHGIHWEIVEGIATITLLMEGRANKVNGAFGEGLAHALDGVLTAGNAVGIIIASGHNANSAREHVDALAAQIILQCFFERLSEEIRNQTSHVTRQTT